MYLVTDCRMIDRIVEYMKHVESGGRPVRGFYSSPSRMSALTVSFGRSSSEIRIGVTMGSDWSTILTRMISIACMQFLNLNQVATAFLTRSNGKATLNSS